MTGAYQVKWLWRKIQTRLFSCLYQKLHQDPEPYLSRSWGLSIRSGVVPILSQIKIFLVWMQILSGSWTIFISFGKLSIRSLQFYFHQESVYWYRFASGYAYRIQIRIWSGKLEPFRMICKLIQICFRIWIQTWYQDCFQVTNIFEFCATVTRPDSHQSWY